MHIQASRSRLARSCALRTIDFNELVATMVNSDLRLRSAENDSEQFWVGQGTHAGDDGCRSPLMLISNARFRSLQIRVNHQVDEFLKPDGRLPSESRASLRIVAAEIHYI